MRLEDAVRLSSVCVDAADLTIDDGAGRRGCGVDDRCFEEGVARCRPKDDLVIAGEQRKGTADIEHLRLTSVQLIRQV